jgi:predicted membrane protein
MRAWSVHRQRSRVVFGVIVIVVGLFALLDNLDLFDIRSVQPFWPLVLVAVGVLKLQQTRLSSGYLTGGVLIALGAAMTLHNLGYIHFRMREWWPVFLIVGGLYVVARGFRSRDDETGGRWLSRPQNQLEHGSRVNACAVMSGSMLKNDAQDFRGGDVTSVMGGVDIDLRRASIATEAVLHVFVVWGGIAIKVPPDWSVVVNGIPLLGGIEDRSTPPLNPAKRLIIEGYVIMGGVEIKN